MAWKRVENYWLGYSTIKKQFYFYYKIQGENSVHQMFPPPDEFLALAYALGELFIPQMLGSI